MRPPTNASSRRTRARSIVAGHPITRLAALHRRCLEVRGSRKGGMNPKRLTDPAAPSTPTLVTAPKVSSHFSSAS